jgi:hypothetical protein
MRFPGRGMTRARGGTMKSLSRRRVGGAFMGVSLAAWSLTFGCGGKTSLEEHGTPGAGGVSGSPGSGAGPGEGAGPGVKQPKGLTPSVPGPEVVELCGDVDCEVGATCVFGRCVAHAVDCNTDQIECDAPVPGCQEGQVPSVVAGCFGPCVDVAECNYVDECAICEAAGTICLGWDTDTQTFYGCADPEDVPDSCNSCDCLPDDICGYQKCLRVTSGIATCGDPQDDVPPPPPPPEGPPPTITMPEDGSYLDGRGALCGECLWGSCDQDVAQCLAAEECSYWHGCLVFCAGRPTEELSACQLDCFNGDAELMSDTLAGLECLLDQCCSECGAPCN